MGFCCRSQIRQTLKKKAFEDAAIPVKQVIWSQPATAATAATATKDTTSQSQPIQIQSTTASMPVTVQHVTHRHTVTTDGIVQQQQQLQHGAQILSGNSGIDNNKNDQSGIIDDDTDMLMTLNSLNTHGTDDALIEVASTVDNIQLNNVHVTK